MAADLHREREITPAAPDELIRGQLAMRSARILPLSAGAAHTFPGDGAGGYAALCALRGNLTVSGETQYALLDAGSACILPAAEPFTVQGVSDCLCMAVLFRGKTAGSLLEPVMTGDGASFPGGAADVREAVAAAAVLEDEGLPGAGVLASSFAYTMLVKLLSRRGAPRVPASDLVESAIGIIQEEFPFLDGLDELAERLEVSKAHLIRAFTQKTGVSPGKYITRVKIEYAKLLLRDPDTAVAYVAEASGFANANYFAKVFRRETGMSPSEYMEGAFREPGEARRPRDDPALW